MTEEYAIRHVYPLSGFNMLVAAYAQSMKSTTPLDIDGFIIAYCREQYGFNPEESARFWKALKTTPYEVRHGNVESPTPLSVKQMLDSSKAALEILYHLQPEKNKEEFEHYRVMSGIRVNYLEFHYILQKINSPEFTSLQKPAVLDELKNLMLNETVLDLHFSQLNKNFLYHAELAEENDLRNIRLKLLYERLSGNK